MANTPKKMKDPTEAALSAIQDALHVKDDNKPDDQTATPAASGLPADAASDAPWPGLRSSPNADVYGDELRRRDDAASARRPAANDDQESIGNILRTIQRRPAKTSYILASAFAAVWMIGGFLL